MKTHSYHIFMFPFKWDTGEEIYKSHELNIRLLDVSRILQNRGRNNSDDPKNKKWVTVKHIDKQDNYYNELKYFHPYVHQALFEFPDEKGNALVEQFEFPAANGWKYEIKINKRVKPVVNKQLLIKAIPEPPDNYYFKKDEKPYSLTIEKVTLDIYPQGIGIFAFHLQNNAYSKPEDILMINQFGRRI